MVTFLRYERPFETSSFRHGGLTFHSHLTTRRNVPRSSFRTALNRFATGRPNDNAVRVFFEYDLWSVARGEIRLVLTRFFVLEGKQMVKWSICSFDATNIHYRAINSRIDGFK